MSLRTFTVILIIYLRIVCYTAILSCSDWIRIFLLFSINIFRWFSCFLLRIIILSEILTICSSFLSHNLFDEMSLIVSLDVVWIEYYWMVCVEWLVCTETVWGIVCKKNLWRNCDFYGRFLLILCKYWNVVFVWLRYVTTSVIYCCNDTSFLCDLRSLFLDRQSWHLWSIGSYRLYWS